MDSRKHPIRERMSLDRDLMPHLNDPKTTSIEFRLPEELIETYLKTEYRTVVDGSDGGPELVLLR